VLFALLFETVHNAERNRFLPENEKDKQANNDSHQGWDEVDNTPKFIVLQTLNVRRFGQELSHQKARDET